MAYTRLNLNKSALKVIYRYTIKHKKTFLFLVVLSVISAIANSIIPFLVGRLIDNLTSFNLIFIGTFAAVPVFIFILAIWFFAKLAADVADWRIALYSETIEELVHAEYIVDGIDRIIKLPVSFHKDHKMGEVFERMNRAGNFLSQIMSHVLIDLAPQFLSIAIALIIAFIINPVFAVILTVAVFLYAFILFIKTPGLAELQTSAHKYYSEAYGDAYETVTNVMPIKQAGAEDHEARRHERGFAKVILFWSRLNAIWQGLNFYQRLLVSVTQLVIFILSVLFIRAGDMTIGELVMFNGYAAMLFGPFVVLGRNWQTIQNSLTSVEWAENILRSPSEIYEPPGAVSPPDIDGNIEFRDVFFKYPGKNKHILENVSFKIKAGMVVALVGESGVGKTSLVDLLSFYYFPESGKIFIDGHDITTLNLKTLRSQIGIVPQEPVLFNDTVKNNIRYGRFEATDEQVVSAASLAHADEFIKTFPNQYEQIVGERGIKLSTGQKQRIAIARAILRNPKILILDEPTSALDSRSEKFIIASLEELMRGRTTFIVAHRFSTVRKADIIFVLDQGRIVETGTHSDLIKIPNGAYRKLYEIQIGLY